MSDHVTSLRWLGNQLDADASDKGIGQGSEGARICWNAATEIASLSQKLEEANTRISDLESKRATWGASVFKELPGAEEARLITSLRVQLAAFVQACNVKDAALNSWLVALGEREVARHEATCVKLTLRALSFKVDTEEISGWLNSQETLGKPFSEVLAQHLHELYETDTPKGKQDDN